MNENPRTRTRGAAESFVPVKSADRVLRVIEILTAQPQGMTYNDVLSVTGWPRSSTHDLLRTMSERGHLAFDDNTRIYRIGLRLWEAGQAYVQRGDLTEQARPSLLRARDELDETVQLSVLDGHENIYIAKVEADHPLKLDSHIGGRLPAYATGLGKVLLSGLSSDEVRARFEGVEFERFTPTTIGDLDTLIEHLEGVRLQGYATDEGEYTAGVFCVAVPIHDASGRVIAAMSTSVPDARSSATSRQRFKKVLLETAAELSSALGYDRAQRR